MTKSQGEKSMVLLRAGVLGQRILLSWGIQQESIRESDTLFQGKIGTDVIRMAGAFFEKLLSAPRRLWSFHQGCRTT